VAQAVRIPVIGNGDLFSPREVARRRAETKIAGVMIGRAAMSAPWIFRQIKQYLATGELSPAPELSERWDVIIEHCCRHAENWGDEEQAIRSMRARLMAYSKNFPAAKSLREKFQQVTTLADVERIAEAHLATTATMSDLVGQAFLSASA
jgi:tRNA-dihydrouridine synthase